MAAMPHSSSRVFVPITGAIALLALAGCAATSGLVDKTGLRLSSLDQEPRIISVEDPPLKPTLDDPAIVVPASSDNSLPAWCEHIVEDTAAQTIIMRSPTLSGSLTDEASASLSLVMSLSSYVKAGLLETAADAKCRRYIAESELQKLIFVSPQGLTAAGFAAKAKSIKAGKAEIEALRRKANAALQNGDIDREQATAINVLADQILAEASQAASQADRRLDAVATPTGNAATLSRELLAAEAELEDINSRMRTFDALDVSASVGWNDDIDDEGVNAEGQSFSGKVSFTMKLGAMAPSRFDHEARAKDAKLRAIASGEGGALWQVSTLHRAHERAIAGLEDQRVMLGDAIGKAESLARSLAAVQSPEFSGSLWQAKLQLIKLRSDRAAVDGSIAEIRRNMKKLANG